MLEYLGGSSLANATARFVAPPTPSPERPAAPLPVETAWEVLDRDLELARSLWDSSSLLVHLDVEHVCFDEWWAPLADLERSAALQAPVVRAIQGVLGEHDIAPLHLLTGRGHHLVWRIGRGTRAFTRLAGLGNLGDDLSSAYLEPRPPTGEAVGLLAGAAQQGLGKVLEHLGHVVLDRVGGSCTAPVQLGAVAVGPGPHGREIVSVDLSQFGDPLHARSIRVPFSLYRKASLMGAPPEIAAKMLVAVPVPEGDPEIACAARGDLTLAAALASSTTTSIPEAVAGTESLIADYRRSDLASFHREFERVEPERPDWWPSSYDRLDLGGLPSCVRRILEEPNDLLLRPACIQLVVRALVAQGWHPRHVAGLIRSKYARQYGWVPGLHFDRPGVRADFYTRLFAGLMAVGRDQLVDLNCVSTQEKGLCPGVPCGWDLRALRQTLLDAHS
jgi:hypothetical protein